MIHVYSIMHNEEFLLPYFLRHYETIADKIFIINDHSTDRTEEIAKSHEKVVFSNFEYSRGLNEDDFNATFIDMYKKHSRGVADWVIVVDADEFIYHKDLKWKLSWARKRGVRIIKATGYTMISDKLPEGQGQIYDECDMGVRTSRYDKKVIFDPELDITFGNGRHQIFNTEGIRPIRIKILLLHYRYLSKEFADNRTRIQNERNGLTNKIKSYRIRRGSEFYDTNITNLVKVI